jgi:hypothetical protein
MIDTQQLQTLGEQVQAIQSRLKHLQTVRDSIQVSLSGAGLMLAPLSQSGMDGGKMIAFTKKGETSVAELRAQNEFAAAAEKLIDGYIFQTKHQLQAAEDAVKALCGAVVPQRVMDTVVTETVLLTDGTDFIPSSIKVECSHPLVQRCEVVSANYVTEPSRATHVNVKVVFICPLDAETIATINLPASLSISGVTTSNRPEVCLQLILS